VVCLSKMSHEPTDGISAGYVHTVGIKETIAARDSPPIDHKSNQSDDQKKELRRSLKELDKWFQYAETIGQTRLNNFLLAFSIMLAGSSVLLQIESRAALLLAFFIDAAGFLMAVASIFFGARQMKFHKMLEGQILNRLEQYYAAYGAEIGSLAVFHVTLMKYPELETDMAAEFDPRDIHGKPCKLSGLSRILSARVFLSLVPALFAILFVAALFVTHTKWRELPMPQVSIWMELFNF
jgi:hypothetical protein